MAYLVKYGTSTLYEPGSDDYAIHGAKISQSTKGYSTFSFTMPPTHPLVDSIALHDSANKVEVYFDDTLLFRGIVTGITRTLWTEYEVTCASELIYLDWVLTRYAPSNNRPGTALAELIGIYNAYAELSDNSGRPYYCMLVDPESRADYVGYLDPNTGVNACDAQTTSPTSILQILMSSIVNEYGAFIRLRYDDDGNRLVGIFPTPPDTSAQVVTLGENLLDYSYSESDDDMYTACYPVGGTADVPMTGTPSGNLVVASACSAGATSISLRTTSGTLYVQYDGILVIGLSSFLVEADMTIGTSAVTVPISPFITYDIAAGTAAAYYGWNPNVYDKTITLNRIPAHTITGAYDNDENIVWHRANALRYGLKCMTFQDSSIKDPYALCNKAKAVLAAHAEPKRSLTVSAVDMAFYSDGYEHLQAGQQVRVVSEPHGLDLTMYVTSADIDMQDPSQTRYQLGTLQGTLSRSLMKTNGLLKRTDNNVITELNDTISTSYVGGLS